MSPPGDGGVSTTPASSSSGLEESGRDPLDAAARTFSGTSTGGIVDGSRSGDPVHAGRRARRRRGGEISAPRALLGGSFSRGAGTQGARAARGFSGVWHAPRGGPAG